MFAAYVRILESSAHGRTVASSSNPTMLRLQIQQRPERLPPVTPGHDIPRKCDVDLAPVVEQEPSRSSALRPCLHKHFPCLFGQSVHVDHVDAEDEPPDKRITYQKYLHGNPSV